LFREPIVNGNRVAVFFSVAATHEGDLMGIAGSGRRCAFEGVSLFQLGPDLLIEEERRVCDFTRLLIQLGVLRVRVAR
jgi:predicted ester cyclase